MKAKFQTALYYLTFPFCYLLGLILLIILLPGIIRELKEDEKRLERFMR